MEYFKLIIILKLCLVSLAAQLRLEIINHNKIHNNSETINRKHLIHIGWSAGSKLVPFYQAMLADWLRLDFCVEENFVIK